MEIIDAVDILGYDSYPLRKKEFEQIYRAIRTLSRLPEEKGVKLKLKGLRADVASRKAHVFARTFGMQVATRRDSGGVMRICRRPHYTQSGEFAAKILEQHVVKSMKGETDYNTEKQGGPLTSRGRSLNSEVRS
jgi:hypothetical protein